MQQLPSCSFELCHRVPVQTASRLSDPPNPLPGPKGTATDRDVVLLNGGYQPRFSMKVRVQGHEVAGSGVNNTALPWPEIRTPPVAAARTMLRCCWLKPLAALAMCCELPCHWLVITALLTIAAVRVMTAASHVQSGEYQRWRLAWATSKRWASIGIVDKSGQPAPCEMLLVGRDAVYLMEVSCWDGGELLVGKDDAGWERRCWSERSLCNMCSTSWRCTEGRMLAAGPVRGMLAASAL